jgi:hypothetical protein
VAAGPRRGGLRRGRDRGRRDRVRRPRSVPPRHRRHRAVSRPGRQFGRRRRDHQRVRPGLTAARAAGRRGGQARARRRPRVAQPRDRLDRAAGAGERHDPQRRPGRGGPRCGPCDAGRAHRARPGAGDVLRAERRHADEPGSGAAVSGAHDRERPGQQRPRRRVPHRNLRFAGGRRGRHFYRPRRADQRVSAGVIVRGRDRRHPDQLPDAGSGHDRARRRHGGVRGIRRYPRRAAQRRLPAPAGGAGLRRDDADADGQRGRGRPVGAGLISTGRQGVDRPLPAAAHRGAGQGRHDARRGDRPGEDLQGRPSADRRRRRQHPRSRPDTWRQRDHPARALRRGQRRRRRHRVGQRPGGPDIPPRTRRQAGHAR